MFWKFNLLTSHLDSLLDKEDVTLHEILDEDDVLQECRAQNQRLLEFLVRPDNVEELVNYITQEPSDETDEKVRYKYPNTACELLTSDVAIITEKVAGDEQLMNKVYGFLEGEGPLNPLLASFFSKVMGLLITRKSEMMLEFLQGKEDFVGQLLRHLGTSAIMDLLLRLITCIESSECHMKCLMWLSEKQLIQRLVSMIDPSNPEEKHCNASQSLCDIIRLSREQMSQLQEKADPDPLLACIESQETITDLLKHMFDGEKAESVLVNGISVIQTLLEFKRLGPDGGSEAITSLDAERLAHGVNNTVQALIPRLKDFHLILKEPPKQHYLPMATTIGNLNPPFGNTRLQTTKLITTLLQTKTAAVNEELANQGTLGVLLDLCFQYMWNNFLHVQVEQCLSTVLSTGSSEEQGEDKTENPMLNQLLKDLKIAERVLEVWEENEQQQSKQGGHRRGYMGHLTKMANHIVTNMEKGCNSEKIKEYFQDLPQDVKERWDTFVSGTLADVNKQNTVELAGGQNLYSSSEDDDPEFRDIPFPQDTAMQQAFSDYQLQQMTSNFIDQFGFNEADFAEVEERASEKFKERISSINFDLNTDEITNAAALFEQACSEHIQQFDDQENEEDLWEEKEITFSQSSDSRQNSTTGPLPGRGIVPPTATPDSDEEEESNSSDSEEELDSPQRIHQSPIISSPERLVADSTTTSTTTTTTEKMDVDNSENWAHFDDISMETTPSSSEDPTSTSWPGQGPESSSEPSQATESHQAPDSWGSANNNTNQVPSSSDNWADFSSIGDSGNLSSTDPGPRSSSPVAMETSDSSSSSRTAAYLVTSAPADLASDISQMSENTESSQNPSCTSSSNAETSSPSSVRPDTTSEVLTSSSHSPGPADTSSSAPDSSEAEVDKSSPENVEPSTTTDNSMEEDGDEELGDNFNFLASSGLMKCNSQATDNSTAQGEPSQTATPPDTNSAKLEDIRAQAKDALNQFTAATSTTSDPNTPPSQNGPV